MAGRPVSNGELPPTPPGTPGTPGTRDRGEAEHRPVSGPPGRPGGGAPGDGAGGGAPGDGAESVDPGLDPGVDPAGGPPAAGDGPGARPRRGAARHRRRPPPVAIVAAAVLLFLVGVLAWYEVEARPFGGNGPEVIVQVRSGQASGSVLDNLASRGVIGSVLAFRLGELVHGSPTIQPGTYLFHENQSFAEVRAILGGGPNVSAVTVFPGLTMREVASKLNAIRPRLGTELVSAARSGAVRSSWEPAGSDDLEGLLGTGTYRVLPDATGSRLLGEMVARFDAQAAGAGATPAVAASLGLTPYQLVTVASIVEKEGYTPPSNFGPVARVVYNRLAAGMRLAMDSTVLYSLGQDGGPVTAADLKLDTPYNTYLHVGLTPTPICFPSANALRAAADPPAGSWLYFVVVQKDGTEAFSTTFAGQLANEALAKRRGVG